MAGAWKRVPRLYYLNPVVDQLYTDSSKTIRFSFFGIWECLEFLEFLDFLFFSLFLEFHFLGIFGKLGMFGIKHIVFETKCFRAVCNMCPGPSEYFDNKVVLLTNMIF